MNKVNIYKNQILNLMAAIEAVTGVTFDERYSEIEDKFWAAADAKDEGKLMFINNQIAGLLDDINKVKGA